MQESFYHVDIEMTTENAESSPIVNIMEEFLGPDETIIESQEEEEEENAFVIIDPKNVQKIVTSILEDFIREIASENNTPRNMVNMVLEQERELGIRAALCFLDSPVHMAEEDNGQIFNVVEAFLNSSIFNTHASGLEILSTEESIVSEAEINLEKKTNRDEIFKHFVSQIISNINAQSSVKNDNHLDISSKSQTKEEVMAAYDQIFHVMKEFLGKPEKVNRLNPKMQNLVESFLEERSLPENQDITTKGLSTKFQTFIESFLEETNSSETTVSEIQYVIKGLILNVQIHNLVQSFLEETKSSENQNTTTKGIMNAKVQNLVISFLKETNCTLTNISEHLKSVRDKFSGDIVDGGHSLKDSETKLSLEIKEKLDFPEQNETNSSDCLEFQPEYYETTGGMVVSLRKPSVLVAGVFGIIAFICWNQSLQSTSWKWHKN